LISCATPPTNRPSDASFCVRALVGDVAVVAHRAADGRNVDDVARVLDLAREIRLAQVGQRVGPHVEHAARAARHVDAARRLARHRGRERAAHAGRVPPREDVVAAVARDLADVDAGRLRVGDVRAHDLVARADDRDRVHDGVEGLLPLGLRAGELPRAARDARLEVAVEVAELAVLALGELAEPLVLVARAVLLERRLDREQQGLVVPGLVHEAEHLRLVDDVLDEIERGLRGDDDALDLREARAHQVEELHAVHVRHQVVADDDRDALALQHAQRLERVVGRVDLVRLPGEDTPQRHEDRRLVVDEEQAVGGGGVAGAWALGRRPVGAHLVGRPIRAPVRGPTLERGALRRLWGVHREPAPGPNQGRRAL
jgi:hypothetical protein